MNTSILAPATNPAARPLFGILLSIFTLSLSVAGHSQTRVDPAKYVPRLDELAGIWEKAPDLASLPAVNDLDGSAQVLRDVLAVGKLSFPPITMTGGTGTLFIDGKTPALAETRWYPYQALRRAKEGDLRIETALRMVYEKPGLLFHIDLMNDGKKSRSFELRIDLTAYTSRHSHWGWKIPRDADTSAFSAEVTGRKRAVVIHDTGGDLSNCFCFEEAPENLSASGGRGTAIWHLTIPPGAKRTINYALAVGSSDGEVAGNATKWASGFEKAFDTVKRDWQEKFDAMFTPGNGSFSGYLPVLRTSDKDMKRIYYMSVVSILSVLRTGFPVAPRVYVSNTPESNCTMMYFWDTREFATTLALLDPVMLKGYLRSWLSRGIYNGYAEEYLTGTLQGPWYSANDYSIFILLNDYLDVTGDREFLSEKVNGITVLAHMDSIATHWESLVRPGQTLADYGGASNLLECVPTYINEVASFNAADVWMMDRVAAIYDSFGNTARADTLRAEAARLLPAVLSLYVPGQGVWDAYHNDGKRVEVRHVFDFATIGLTIPNDLTSRMKDEMTAFVERELLTDHWMRAQSLSDPAASVSDRPDHGPMGAFCAWPPETMAAMCEFGKFRDALDFLHRCTATTYEGPFSQSRELLGRTPDARVRIAERGTGGLPSQTYNASNGGSFAETIIREFFGFKPDFLSENPLPDRRARGFSGELIGLHKGSEVFTVESTSSGLRLVPAK